MESTYSESFKRKMVQRMLLPGGPRPRALAKEVGVPYPTLYRWLSVFGRVGGMSKKGGKSAGGSAPRRPEDWTALERLRAVSEASGLSGDELGEFLRREGLHEEALAEWRQAALDALQPSAPNARSGDKKHIKRTNARIEEHVAGEPTSPAPAQA